MKEEEKGLVQYIKDQVIKLGEWVRPNPNDSHLLKVVKLFYKSLALLVLIALSPLLLLILLFVFFAAM